MRTELKTGVVNYASILIYKYEQEDKMSIYGSSYPI